jgi:hypothetical protein
MVVGTALSAGYPLLPSTSVAATVLYNGVGVLSFLAIIVGVRHNRPADPRGWYIYAGGVITFVAGDICYEVSGLIMGQHPYPYFDDLLYFAAYPMLWMGLLRIVRGIRGDRSRDLAGAIDAAVIATGLGLVYWVFVISPALGDHSTPFFTRLVTVCYPTCDVLMCAVITRMLTSAGRRRPVPPGLPADRRPARRRHPVRRGPGPLAAPGPRVRQPGRLHPDRRAERPDRRARRVGPAHRLRQVPRLAHRARPRRAPADQRQRLHAAAGRARLCPGRRRRARRD